MDNGCSKLVWVIKSMTLYTNWNDVDRVVRWKEGGERVVVDLSFRATQKRANSTSLSR